jgi:hypothetical protein
MNLSDLNSKIVTLGFAAFAAFTFAIPLTLVFSELGTLICAKLTGYRFRSFRLWKFLWAKDDNGKIKLIKLTEKQEIPAHCDMKICEKEEDFKFILFGLGGRLFNMLFGIIFIVLMFFVHIPIIQAIFFGLAICFFFTGPFMLFKKINGESVWKIVMDTKKSPEAKHGMFLQSWYLEQIEKGNELKQYPAEKFEVSATADTGNTFIAFILALSAERYEELGEFEKAYAELMRINAEKMPPTMRLAVYSSIIFYDLVFIGGEEHKTHAKEILDLINKYESETKDKNNFSNSKIPDHIICRAAIEAFIYNNIPKAREIIAEARAIIPTFKNKGSERSALNSIFYLENLLFSIPTANG